MYELTERQFDLFVGLAWGMDCAGGGMNKSCARPVTPEEFEQGYTICDCGKYAHVFRASTLSRLPKGYNGEHCRECSCLMVAVEMLMPMPTTE